MIVGLAVSKTMYSEENSNGSIGDGDERLYMFLLEKGHRNWVGRETNKLSIHSSVCHMYVAILCELVV